MRLIKLLRPHGSLFTGETGGYDDDEAVHLVADKIGIYADGQPEPEKPIEQPEPWEFNPKTDPFVTDGVSKSAAQSLHQFHLHTVEAVRQFIAETPEGEKHEARVNAIDGITDQQAAKIVMLYGPHAEQE